MKRILSAALLLLMLSIVISSCHSSRGGFLGLGKKDKCACPSKKGLVGY